jgi:dimethylglycine dehydrogenase
MMVMSHQYMLFDEVPEVAAWTAEAGHKLPLLRDVDSSYYLRQEKNGFNLGPYERNCKAHWVTPDDPMPEDFRSSSIRTISSGWNGTSTTPASGCRSWALPG